MGTASKINFTFVIAIAISTIGGWAATNQPRLEAPWPASVSGFAFSPFRRGQTPSRGQYPLYDEIDADLELIAHNSSSWTRLSACVMSDKPGLWMGVRPAFRAVTTACSGLSFRQG